MKQDEMTICECVEYLDSMVGDNKEIKDCLDYIECKAKSMDKRLREYKSLFEEKQKTKEETNFEHFFEYLSTKRMSDFALIDGRVTQCVGTRCSKCKFNNDYCIEEKFTWLKQPYEKPVYKLTKFEYDLLELYKSKYSFKLSNALRGMKEKGYFRSVDENAKIEDILENCEVVEDRKEEKK